MVHHPSHYDTGDKTYEPYRVIEAWGCNFNIGSAIKYLSRYEKKWNPIEDLEKAKQYIDFEIERLREYQPNGERFVKHEPDEMFDRSSEIDDIGVIPVK